MENRWPVEGEFDVIFCRNVLIYFNTETQKKLLPRLTERIVPGGHLMLGHSENLPWLAETMTPLGYTIHEKSSESKRKTTLTQPQHQASLPLVVKSETPTCQAERKPLKQSIQPKLMSTKEITAGQIFASMDSIEIATTLGSCVAACLFDPVMKVGGMNHFMLPIHATDPAVCGRYGVHAMELLINEITKMGGDRRRLRAKIFGGSSVLKLSGANVKVGQVNSDFIRKFLKDEDMPIDGEKLGGLHPLRVHFIPVTGIAFVKPVTNTRVVIDNEEKFLDRVSSLSGKQSEVFSFRYSTLGEGSMRILVLVLVLRKKGSAN